MPGTVEVAIPRNESVGQYNSIHAQTANAVGKTVALRPLASAIGSPECRTRQKTAAATGGYSAGRDMYASHTGHSSPNPVGRRRAAISPPTRASSTAHAYASMRLVCGLTLYDTSIAIPLSPIEAGPDGGSGASARITEHRPIRQSIHIRHECWGVPSNLQAYRYEYSGEHQGVPNNSHDSHCTNTARRLGSEITHYLCNG